MISDVAYERQFFAIVLCEIAFFSFYDITLYYKCFIALDFRVQATRINNINGREAVVQITTVGRYRGGRGYQGGIHTGGDDDKDNAQVGGGGGVRHNARVPAMCFTL